MNPSSRNRPPSFSFYVKDWLTSKKRATMPLACQAAYVNLLAHCWDTDDCSLPNDSPSLAALSELREAWETHEAQLRVCFVEHTTPGRITNPRLHKEFAERMAFKAQKALAGRQGGKLSGVTRRKLKTKPNEANAKQTRSIASLLLEANVKQNEALQSSVFSLSSLPLKKEKEKRPRVVESDEEWLAKLRTDAAYQHIDFTVEFAKMDNWLALPKNKGRKKTRSFILNWLNKIERPIQTAAKKRIVLT